MTTIYFLCLLSIPLPLWMESPELVWTQDRIMISSARRPIPILINRGGENHLFSILITDDEEPWDPWTINRTTPRRMATRIKDHLVELKIIVGDWKEEDIQRQSVYHGIGSDILIGQLTQVVGYDWSSKIKTKALGCVSIPPKVPTHPWRHWQGNSKSPCPTYGHLASFYGHHGVPTQNSSVQAAIVSTEVAATVFSHGIHHIQIIRHAVHIAHASAKEHHGDAFNAPKHKCSVQDIVESAKVCNLKANEADHAPVELDIKKINDNALWCNEDCLTSTRRICFKGSKENALSMLQGHHEDLNVMDGYNGSWYRISWNILLGLLSAKWGWRRFNKNNN